MVDAAVVVFAVVGMIAVFFAVFAVVTVVAAEVLFAEFASVVVMSVVASVLAAIFSPYSFVALAFSMQMIVPFAHLLLLNQVVDEMDEERILPWLPPRQLPLVNIRFVDHYLASKEQPM